MIKVSILKETMNGEGRFILLPKDIEEIAKRLETVFFICFI